MTTSYPRFPRAFMSASREELSNIMLTIKGPGDEAVELPQDLQGHVFINSFAGTAASLPPEDQPADAIPEQTIMPAGGRAALFDGDGMVYRLDFHQAPGKEHEVGKAWLSSKLIKPPAFFADQVTHQNPEYDDFDFFNLGLARASLLGSCNQLNTAFVKVKFSEEYPPRLLATNDAARPFEIDPCSLKVVAPIGDLRSSDPNSDSRANAVWSPLAVLPGVFELLMSSAHPCITFSSVAGEEKSELFTVSDIKTPLHLLLHRSADDQSKADKLSLIRWSLSSKKGEKFDTWEVMHQGQPAQILQSTHMLGITENYIIIADTAMKFEQIEAVFLMGVNFVDSLLEILTSTGEKRERAVDGLEKALEVLLKLIRLNVNSFRRSVWRSIGIAFRALISAFKNLKFRQKLKLTRVLSEDIFQESRASSRSLLTEPGVEDELLELLSNDYQDLAELHHTSLQDDFAASFEFEPSILAEDGLRRGLGTSAENILESIEHSLESVESIQDSIVINLFLKACNVIKKSTVVLEQEIADELVKQLKLRVASRQNSDTPLFFIRRSDLNSPEALSTGQVEAKRIEVKGAFAHLFTDYSETKSGEVVIIAPMTDALDPAEYITHYDQPQLLENVDIDDLAGMIPMGLDSNELALIKVDPTVDQATIEPYRLTFDKVQNTPEYANRQIFSNFRENPLYIGLYAYRDDTPQITDVFVMQGGAFPELLTEFVFDLYENYAPQRQIPLDKLLGGVERGVPMIMTHTKVDRDNPESGMKVVQTYEFDPGEVIFSLQFAPRLNSNPTDGDDGYIVCTVVHSDSLYSSTDPESDWSDNCEIWIFDAKKLADGPQYRLSHPRLNFGLTLHSTWLESLAPAPVREYSFEQDYGSRQDYFVRNYLSITRNRAKEEEVLTSLFEDIRQAFDQYREQTNNS